MTAELRIVASGKVTCTEHTEAHVYMFWGYSPVCSECLRIEVQSSFAGSDFGNLVEVSK